MPGAKAEGEVKKKKKVVKKTDGGAEDPEKKTKKKKVKKEGEEGEKKKKKKKPADAGGAGAAEDGKKKKKKKKKEAEDGSAKPAGDKEADGENEYDEDFEDYGDDDFEAEDAEDAAPSAGAPAQPPNAILQAINAENAAAIQRREDGAPKLAVPPRGGLVLPARKFVDLKLSQQQIEAQKRLQRGKELFQLVELDVVVCDILDMPPLTKYKMYIRSFGNRSATQAAVQTNEDVAQKETQSEEIETSDKTAQFPDDLGTASRQQQNNSAGSIFANSISSIISDPRLVSFLDSASQVTEALLEENMVDNAQKKATFTSAFNFSSQYINIETPDFLSQRYISQIAFSPTLPHLVLASYTLARGQKSEGSAAVNQHGFVCLWNLNDPQKPSKVLACEGQPVSCVFSPDGASVAIAGTTSGSLVAWDLREFSSQHPSLTISPGLEAQLPAYSTDAIFEENHQAPIVRVVIVEERASRPALSEDGPAPQQPAVAGGEGIQKSFQLASVDDLGIVNVWAACELQQADWGGSEADYGLSVGSRWKLIKTGSIKTHNPLRDAGSRMQATDLAFAPEDINTFLVTSELGQIIRGQRSGSADPSLPSVYQPQPGSFSAARAVSFAHHTPGYFLCSFDDNSVNLYSSHSALPLSTWDGGAGSIHSLLWSPSRPGVFFASSNSHILIWDLTKSDKAPEFKDDLSKKKGPLKCIALSEDRGGVRAAALGIGYADGHAEIHLLSGGYVKPAKKEQEKIESLFSSLL